MSASDDHPVAAGLAALVGVGLAVGLLLGLIALVATRTIGLGGESATASSSQDESLFVPTPTKTEGPSGPLITLAPQPDAQQGDDKATDKATKQKKQQKISLQAGQDQVGSMDRIDLTGSYPGGEGAILQVQRREGGTWEDFPVTVSVANGTYSTYVQTGRSGKNRFRVRDSDKNKTSNPVTVRVQ